jgi:hypothetical protein
LLPQNATGITPFYLHFSFYLPHDVLSATFGLQDPS